MRCFRRYFINIIKFCEKYTLGLVWYPLLFERNLQFNSWLEKYHYESYFRHSTLQMSLSIGNLHLIILAYIFTLNYNHFFHQMRRTNQSSNMHCSCGGYVLLQHEIRRMFLTWKILKKSRSVLQILAAIYRF